MAKTALERLKSQIESKLVLLDMNFAGVNAGDTLFVEKPKSVDRCSRNLSRNHRCCF